MENLTGIIGVIAGLALFVHMGILAFHNLSRIKKLIWYIHKFNKEEILSNNDYEMLFNRYTSSFYYFEFYPDKEDFKNLYQDQEFERFVRKSKWLIKYCATVIATSFIALAVIGDFKIG